VCVARACDVRVSQPWVVLCAGCSQSGGELTYRTELVCCCHLLVTLPVSTSSTLTVLSVRGFKKVGVSVVRVVRALWRACRAWRVD
jgi:hypothetical protein